MNEHIRTGEAKMAEETTRRHAEGASGFRSIGEIAAAMAAALAKKAAEK